MKSVNKKHVSVIITLLILSLILLSDCSSKKEKNRFPILLRETIISYVQWPPYVTNPYTPDALASYDHNHVLSWAHGIYLDNMPLKVSGVYTIPFNFAKFSPTNESVAFGTRTDKEEYYIYLYENSALRKYGPFKNIQQFEFSHDGKHFLYIVEDLKNKFSIFVDGEQRFGPFNEPPKAIFRLDPSRILYTVIIKGNWWVFENGNRKFGPFTEIKDILVSTKDRTAIIARRGEQYYVILDGKEEGPLENIWGFSFDPLGKRYGYAVKASERKQEKVIIDGNEVESFKEVVIPPFFSPNGKSVGFVGKQEPSSLSPRPSIDGLKQEESIIVLDTRESKEFILRVNNSIREKRIYSGIRLLGELNEGIHYACVNDSGNRILYFDVEQPRYLQLKISGVLGTGWNVTDFIKGGEPRFVSEKKVSFVALKHEDMKHQSKVPVYKVEIEFSRR